MSEVPQRVLITCPETGERAPTMLRLRPGVFDALEGDYRFRCSKCGEVHAWRREDAWLEARPGR